MENEQPQFAVTKETKTNNIGVEKIDNLSQVGEKLNTEEPGVIILDVDYTIKTHDLSHPGRIPEKAMKMLMELADKGWEIGFATNQPKEGHQVANFIGRFDKDSYYFPSSINKIFGKGRIFGSGWDFLIKRFKKEDESPELVADWVREKLKSKMGKVFFVGDLPGDVTFFDKVASLVEDIKRGIVFKMPDSPVKF